MSEREDWIQRARTDVEAWERVVEELAESGDEGGERTDKALAMARHELGEARTHLARVEEAGREAWEGAQVEIEKAWDATRAAMAKELQEVRKTL